ncbi:MAG: hypothetical protein GY810_17030 [Aureispira sp.]|nr:hypothetical protein [Aureispira sp.]
MIGFEVNKKIVKKFREHCSIKDPFVHTSAYPKPFKGKSTWVIFFIIIGLTLFMSFLFLSASHGEFDKKLSQAFLFGLIWPVISIVSAPFLYFHAAKQKIKRRNNIIFYAVTKKAF